MVLRCGNMHGTIGREAVVECVVERKQVDVVHGHIVATVSAGLVKADIYEAGAIEAKLVNLR